LSIGRALGGGKRKGNMKQPAMSGSVAEAFANQVDYCRSNDATITMRVVAALARLLDDPGAGA